MGCELMTYSGQAVSEKRKFTTNLGIISKASGLGSCIKTNKIKEIAEYVTDTAGKEFGNVLTHCEMIDDCCFEQIYEVIPSTRGT